MTEIYTPPPADLELSISSNPALRRYIELRRREGYYLGHFNCAYGAASLGITPKRLYALEPAVQAWLDRVDSDELPEDDEGWDDGPVDAFITAEITRQRRARGVK